MNILKKGCLTSIFFLSLVGNTAFADPEGKCPAELVNFWKNYAMNSQNLEAIPGFLLTNECLRATTSPEFYLTTLKRLDHPENVDFVTVLYAELSWTDGYKY